MVAIVECDDVDAGLCADGVAGGTDGVADGASREVGDADAALISVDGNLALSAADGG